MAADDVLLGSGLALLVEAELQAEVVLPLEAAEVSVVQLRED